MKKDESLDFGCLIKTKSPEGDEYLLVSDDSDIFPEQGALYMLAYTIAKRSRQNRSPVVRFENPPSNNGFFNEMQMKYDGVPSVLDAFEQVHFWEKYQLACQYIVQKKDEEFFALKHSL